MGEGGGEAFWEKQMSECLEACPQIICTKQLPLRLNLVAAYLFILYPKSNHKMLTVQNPKGGGGGGTFGPLCTTPTRQSYSVYMHAEAVSVTGFKVPHQCTTAVAATHCM